jgi:hypothetical protein
MRTNWTEVGKFYGLRPPFNFRVAIPLLLNVCLLGVIFLISAFLFLRGYLDFGTARFFFFFYLAFLLVIGAVFSKASKLSYAILLWCTIELGLGPGLRTRVNGGFGVAGSLIPWSGVDSEPPP